MEKNLKNGELMIGQTFAPKLEPCGLRIDVAIRQVAVDKPTLFEFTYRIDPLKFKQYLKEDRPDMTQGMLMFEPRGVRILNIGGAEKWDKTAFSIDNGDSERIFLNLLFEDTVFHIHRDLFAGKEWEILMENSEGSEQLAFNQANVSKKEDMPF